MASVGVFPPTPVYRARIEPKVNRRTRRLYYRYVIFSERGEELFDGCAGDVQEANESIKAHLQFLNEHRSAQVTPLSKANC